MPELPDDKAKVSAILVTVILVVAIVVLAVDWQIKTAILTEAGKLRDSIDSFERKYWNGQKADVIRADDPSDPTDASSSWDHHMVGVTRMEAANAHPGNVEEIRKAARTRPSVDTGTGIPGVAVPKED